MDLATASAQIPHVDMFSLLLGAIGGPAIVACAIKAITPIPKMLANKLKDRVKALAAAGKIDAPTMRLLKALGAAAFSWIDEELPDEVGADKMAALLDRLALVPYLGILVRIDRPGVQEVLQAAYNAINGEAKAEAKELGGTPDAPKIPPTPAVQPPPVASPAPPVAP